jgi:hypothetical protein
MDRLLTADARLEKRPRHGDRGVQAGLGRYLGTEFNPFSSTFEVVTRRS